MKSYQMFSVKLSRCQIFRCQCVRVPNCLSAKMSICFCWCHIVRFKLLVPNCPGAKFSGAKLSYNRGWAFLMAAQDATSMYFEKFSQFLCCSKYISKKLSQLIPLRSMAHSTFDKVLLKRELREAAGMNALLGNRY